MAYNGRPRGYGDPRYQSRPANYGTQYNDHDQVQYYDNQVQYQPHYDQNYARCQQDAYDHNQQLPQYQHQPQDRYTVGRQYAAQMNPSDHYPVEYDQSQQRQYHYDERFRADSRNVQQPGRGDRPFRANRQSPETSRPSTSASNHRSKRKFSSDCKHATADSLQKNVSWIAASASQQRLWLGVSPFVRFRSSTMSDLTNAQ